MFRPPAWSAPPPARRRQGFTLVELLVVVLLIGILAAIALPRLLGQRTRAKNAAAQAAARHALVAARSYYTQNSESYVGLGPTQLQGYESSLGSSEPADTVKPGDAAANPQNIWIGNGLDGTNPNTVANGDSNGGSIVVLCSVSKGDTVYCVKDTDGVTSYLALQGAATSVSSAASGSFSANGWTGAPATVPTLTRDTVGAKLHDDFSDGDYTNNPAWIGIYPADSWSVSGGMCQLASNTSPTWGVTRANISNSDYFTFKLRITSVRMQVRYYFENLAGTSIYGFELGNYSGDSDIWKRVSGSDSTITTWANSGLNFAGADQWLATKWNGSSLTVWRDGTQVANITDASHSSLDELFMFRGGATSDVVKIDDVAIMDSWNVTVNGLPAGYQARVRNSSGTAIVTATAASGTATLDFSGKAAFPYADVQVLDGSGTVKATLAPSATVSGHSVAGVFGGDVYTYSS